MSMQNPLARVRGKGSSGGGAHHWRSQRYSALILLLLTTWVLWLGVSLAGADYATASRHVITIQCRYGHIDGWYRFLSHATGFAGRH